MNRGINKSELATFIILLSCMLTLAGCISVHRSMYAKSHLTLGAMEEDCEVPFVIDDIYRAFVTLKVNGIEGKFVLDTGCNFIALTSECIAACGIDIQDDMVSTALLGNGREWKFDKVSSQFTLELGRAQIQCDGFPVIDEAFSGHFGIVGCAFLAIYGGQIDFKRQVILFSQRNVITNLTVE